MPQGLVVFIFDHFINLLPRLLQGMDICAMVRIILTCSTCRYRFIQTNIMSQPVKFFLSIGTDIVYVSLF